MGFWTCFTPNIKKFYLSTKIKKSPMKQMKKRTSYWHTLWVPLPFHPWFKSCWDIIVGNLLGLPVPDLFHLLLYNQKHVGFCMAFLMCPLIWEWAPWWTGDWFGVLKLYSRTNIYSNLNKLYDFSRWYQWFSFILEILQHLEWEQHLSNSMAGAAGKLNEDISLVLAAVNQQFSKGQTMVKTVM